MTETATDPWANETSPGSAIAPHQQLAMLPDADFAALLEDADFVKGYTLVEKETLVGKPFVITNVRFNPGAGGDFVSCESVTQDNVSVVFNDGSTGIRRQIVAYLTQKGLIDPGKGEESGPETRYDNPASEWKTPADKGEKAKDPGFPVRLVCPRGTRRSDYPWEGGTATTWYLG